MSYRPIYIGLGLLAVAAVILGVTLTREGTPVELPGPIEDVTPEPGSSVIRQTTVEIDLEVGYTAVIYVDGFAVPDAVFVEGTGVYSWAPSSGSPVLTQWAPGEHTVRLEWQSITGPPDFGTFEWTFRVR